MASLLFDIRTFDELASTNDEAKRLAEDGAREGVVITAARQTAGRGRHGRQWVSEEGNLFASILLRPEVAMSQAATLPFVAATALSDTLAPMLPKDVEIGHKWPNDVLLNGGKVSGLLLEAGGSRLGFWVVLGIGVNLETYPDKALYPATSLREAGLEVQARPFLQSYLSAFRNLYQLWQGHGFGPIRQRWLKRALKLGERIEVVVNDERLSGIFENVDETGTLHLRLGDGTSKQITAGDVFLVS